MKYTNEDKTCTHCGGEISGHSCGDRIIYWCDDCGSNNKEEKPNIVVEVKD